MAEIPINIFCKHGKLDADRKHVPFGKHKIVWKPTGKANVTGITFDDSNAPFSPPKKDNGTWSSDDDNRNTTDQPQVWKYTIEGSCGDAEPAGFDPEIVNDPEGGRDDVGKGKGKDDDRGSDGR